MENPTDINRDRFLTGKAHCILTQYSVMQEMGIITEEEKYTFKQDGGMRSVILKIHALVLNIPVEPWEWHFL